MAGDWESGCLNTGEQLSANSPHSASEGPLYVLPSSAHCRLLKEGDAPDLLSIVDADAGVGLTGAWARGVKVQISASPSHLGDKVAILDLGVDTGEQVMFLEYWLEFLGLLAQDLGFVAALVSLGGFTGDLGGLGAHLTATGEPGVSRQARFFTAARSLLLDLACLHANMFNPRQNTPTLTGQNLGKRNSSSPQQIILLHQKVKLGPMSLPGRMPLTLSAERMA